MHDLYNKICAILSNSFESKDGLEAALSTDKDSYRANEAIVASLDVENTNAHAVKDVILENTAPDGYILSEDSDGIITFEELAAGEKASLKTVFVPESSSEPEKPADTNPNTGGIALGFALTALFGGVTVVCFVWKKKAGKRLLSLLLCFATVGMTSLQSFKSDAAEPEKASIALSKTVTAGDKEITVKAAVSYGSAFKMNDAEAAPDPIHFEFTDYKGSKVDDDYLYYSDDYFSSPSTNYNPHLATLSMMMTKYSMNPGDPSSPDDTEWFEQQSDRVCAFFRALNFTSNDICVNDDYKTRTAFDTIGIAAASKKIGDTTVIASTVRSGGYFNEWENNVFLGTGENSDMMHEGWYNAANKVIDFIGEYIKTQNITGKVKLWISGYSRGGATMNLTAGLLDNKIQNNGSDKVFEGVTLERDDLYAYTFEAPQGANFNSTTVAAPKDSLYNNIFNIVNPNDLVTKVAMGWVGFTRFGIDKFITTQFFDYDNFETNRNTVKALYATEHPNKSWNSDNFQMYTIPASTIISSLTSLVNLVREVLDVIDSIDEGKLPSAIVKDTTKINYDANIAETIVLDRGMLKIGDRNNYANNYQPLLRKLTKYMMNDCPAPNAPSKTSLVGSIVWQGILYSLFGDSDSVSVITKLTGITSEEASRLNSLVADIYADYPNDLMSLGVNISDVFSNHDTDVSVAHVRAQDSYYIDAYNKENPDNTITIVPLRNDASFCRIDLNDFNDCTLKSAQDGYKDSKVYIEGSSLTTSTIHNVANGYAAGYYHYASYERIELFFPSYYDHKLNYASYSNDWDHDVSATYYYYPSQKATTYRERWLFRDDKDTFCDEGPYDETFKAANTLISDLTNTTWKFNDDLSETLKSCNISFTSNGKQYTSITNKFTGTEKMPIPFPDKSGDIYVDHYSLCYGNTEAAITDKIINYTTIWNNDAYMTITITGGADVYNQELIDWLYNNATLVT